MGKAAAIEGTAYEFRRRLATILAEGELLLEGERGELTDDQHRAVEAMVAEGHLLTALVAERIEPAGDHGRGGNAGVGLDTEAPLSVAVATPHATFGGAVVDELERSGHEAELVGTAPAAETRLDDGVEYAAIDLSTTDPGTGFGGIAREGVSLLSVVAGEDGTKPVVGLSGLLARDAPAGVVEGVLDEHLEEGETVLVVGAGLGSGALGGVAPVEEERLFETCVDDPRTRAAAARLLSACEHPRAGEIGTSLLIWEGGRPLSVFGLDTLYVLNRAGSTPLLYRGSTDAGDWDPALLVQVCTVLRYCPSTNAPTEAFDWLRALLAHESPTVRAAAIGAFAGRGWRPALRERIDAAALVADPDPAVRRAAYGLLAAWGDRPAIALLERAVHEEDHDRCRLVAVRALYGNGVDAPADGRTWAWVRAEGALG